MSVPLGLTYCPGGRLLKQLWVRTPGHIHSHWEKTMSRLTAEIVQGGWGLEPGPQSTGRQARTVCSPTPGGLGARGLAQVGNKCSPATRLRPMI